MKEKITNFITFITSDRKRMVVAGILVVLVIGFLGTVFMYISKQSANELTSSLPPEVGDINGPIQITNKKTIPATLSLVVKGNSTIKVHDEIVFEVVGDTSDQIIRGYDATFKFDRNLVSYVKSQNLYSDFDYQQRTRNNWIIISSVQKNSSNSKISLKNKPLVQLRFKALQPGVAHFPLSFVEGRLSDSNLINEKSEDILTKVAGVTVRITQ